MIVESVRLKNIKSYGEGSDGNGITIFFLPGTNRVAGKNGHGKTTLIESLGYALFLTEPVFEENFQLETYFLRAGKKAAEIDVTFKQLGDLYRIERGLGPQNKRRTKVVQLNDGSTCAEGDKEVSLFISRLFGFPDRKRFSELFWKLIGVRQGRLTWPFDSKPSVAKDYFEPLLEVEVFRECFHSLKPAVDEFLAQLHDQEKIKAGIEERIRERSESAAGVEEQRLQVRTHEQQLESLNESLATARKAIEQLEAREFSLKVAESLTSAANNTLLLARQQRESAQQRLRESEAAGDLLARLTPGYQAFERAGIGLQDHRAKQSEQRRLEKELAETEKKKAELDGKAEAARLQSDALTVQKREREAEKNSFSVRIESLRSHLSGSQPEFEKKKRAGESIMRNLSGVRHFVDSFGILLAQKEATLNKIKEVTADLSAWDASVLQKANRQEGTAEAALQNLRRQLAAANAERSSLSTQLEEITGGICPFLKERCRQFDPSKVEGDLRQKNATVDYLGSNIKSAESMLNAVKNEREKLEREERGMAGKSSQLELMAAEFSGSFNRLEWEVIRKAENELHQWIFNVPPMPSFPHVVVAEGTDANIMEGCHRQYVAYFTELKNWREAVEYGARDWFDAFQEEDRHRNAERQDEVNGNDQLKRIEHEISKLSAAASNQREAAVAYEDLSAELVESVVNLGQRLEAFGSLADEIARLEQIQLNHRNDYQQYLGAKPLADELSARAKGCHIRRQAEATAAETLRLREIEFAKLSKDFDPSALPAWRREFERISAAAVKESVNLDNAKRELLREEDRFREWQEACAKRDELGREIRRLEAAIELAETARIVLRDSAPAVAQHLCDRIAARAQQIFNQINHDPVELNWEAAPRYSLRVIPGERRFAMLSGGEQTKLALAMTLAMVQEFSGLRFCIFDEPTYGVDAESREKLGEVMLEAQKAAGLEQLILVSHDDAFDGKIENAILLQKKAADGTQVIQTSR